MATLLTDKNLVFGRRAGTQRCAGEHLSRLLVQCLRGDIRNHGIKGHQNSVAVKPSPFSGPIVKGAKPMGGPHRQFPNTNLRSMLWVDPFPAVPSFTVELDRLFTA